MKMRSDMEKEEIKIGYNVVISYAQKSNNGYEHKMIECENKSNDKSMGTDIQVSTLSIFN